MVRRSHVLSMDSLEFGHVLGYVFWVNQRSGNRAGTCATWAMTFIIPAHLTDRYGF